eukprot:IDg2047t1
MTTVPITTVPPTRGNPYVKGRKNPAAFIALPKAAERERFAAVLTVTDSILDQVVHAIEDMVDPHNERRCCSSSPRFRGT